MSNMNIDEILVARCLNHGDQQAFAQLMLRHQLMVRSLLQRLCRREPHVVDDFLQETFLRAWMALDTYRAQAKFSTWLYRIASNLVADRCRRKKLDCCDLELADNEVQCEPLYQCDLRRDLQMAMSGISCAQRQAVELCLQNGHSHSSAAAVLDMPLGTVKTHVARGRASLQQLLAHWQDVA
jgi:RNA polymerase sigma-70 factor (ECF subfamily)